MFRKIRKAIEYRVTWKDVISYLAITFQRRWSHFWGTMGLRWKAFLFGVAIGKGTAACGPVILGRWPGSRIVIGKGVSLISSSRRSTAATLYAPVRFRTFARSASIIVGDGAQLSGTAVTARSRTISIGRNTMFGPNCVVTDSDFHALWPAETRHLVPAFERDADVTIGNNVWVGMGSFILKGVTIGDGAIIGAGSIVTHDIPPHCVAAGNPARPLGDRTSAGRPVSSVVGSPLQ